MIGQRREKYRPEYHADDENRLRQVLEVLTVTNKVPLKTENTSILTF